MLAKCRNIRRRKIPPRSSRSPVRFPVLLEPVLVSLWSSSHSLSGGGLNPPKSSSTLVDGTDLDFDLPAVVGVDKPRCIDGSSTKTDKRLDGFPRELVVLAVDEESTDKVESDRSRDMPHVSVE